MMIPKADLLKARGEFVWKIHQYFHEQKVTAVTTPVLAPYGSTDPSINNISFVSESHENFLQSSPEFAMKRMLSAGSGDIYQICPAFRRGEQSPWHRSEFSMLEWYRIGFDHHQLMDDVEALIQAISSRPLIWDRQSYGELFYRCLGIDPHTAPEADLIKLAEGFGYQPGSDSAGDRGALLDLLFALGVQTVLEDESRSRARNSEYTVMRAIFVYDFPVAQSAYAKIHEDADGRRYAERFELLLNGVEVANGYHELTDATEQCERHTQEQQRRTMRGLPIIAVDPDLIRAFERGLPSCAGVAIGLDRLFCLLLGLRTLDDLEFLS